jgi:hypothetical protein
MSRLVNLSRAFTEPGGCYRSSYPHANPNSLGFLLVSTCCKPCALKASVLAGFNQADNSKYFEKDCLSALD